MISEENKSLQKIQKIGEKLGFAFSYLLFTAILFFILTILNKLPESWSYARIILLTLIITIAGIIIKKVLR